MSVTVGDKAPEFTLPGPGYPGDDTPVCTKQLNAYNHDLGEFEELDAHVLGISSQDLASHEKFAGKHGLKMPLLADTDKSVAGMYGTLGPLGFPRRSVFVVDRTGVIRYAHRAIAGLTYRPVSELVAVLQSIDGKVDGNS
jgi:peroxiredoxin Q/BCP